MEDFTGEDITEIITDIYLLDFYERKYGAIVGSSFSELIIFRELFPGEINEENDYIYNLDIFEERLKTNLPIIHEILVIGNGKISLVNLSVLDIMFVTDENYFDFDLRIHSCTLEEAKILIERCLQLPDISVYYYKDHTKLIFMTQDDGEYTIKIFLTIFEDKVSLLKSLPIVGRHCYDPVSKYYSTLSTALTLAIKSYPIDFNSNIRMSNEYNAFDMLPICHSKILDDDNCQLPLIIYDCLRCNSFSLKIPNNVQEDITTEMSPLTMYKNIVNVKNKFPKEYTPIIIGISNDRYIAFSGIKILFNINNDIFKLLCNYWLSTEVSQVKNKYLTK